MSAIAWKTAGLAAAFLLPGLASGPARGAAPVYGYEVVRSYPHDHDAFTQGLIFRDGFLYEGTGIYGASSLRKVELETGAVVKQHDLPGDVFGEGITAFRDTILQITWRNFVGYAFVERDTFDLIETFYYAWEGWGLTHDDTHLIVTDGSSTIRFLDPQTLEPVSEVLVRDGEVSVPYLNELEYLDGRIYANVLPSDRIAVIHPQTGLVEAWLDLAGLQDSVAYDPNAYILNGIAFDGQARRLFVTGKWWPKLFEIDVATLHPEGIDGETTGLRGTHPSLRVFPNPSRGSCRVVFASAEKRPAILQVFDPSGRCVRSLAADPRVLAGHGVDPKLGDLPSGSYVIRLESEGTRTAGRILLLR